MGKIRGNHVAPGTYSEFNDLSYEAKTIGITTAAVVGETQMGPAFDPTLVADWGQYTSKFGGTSPEKFDESQYPKYELPYIAKEYLKKSDQLYVCRVLGLSGYNAGPAFIITACKESTVSGVSQQYVIAVLRSRGKYSKYGTLEDFCAGKSTYDTLSFDCDQVVLEPYTSPAMKSVCSDVISGGTSARTINVTPTDLGHFTIVCYGKVEGAGSGATRPVLGRYPVSLNPGAKDYIYDVIGNSPKNPKGTAPVVFVEELYDLRLRELAEKGLVDRISDMEVPELSGYTTVRVDEVQINAITDPVADFVEIPYNNLTKKQVGQTYLASQAGTRDASGNTNGFLYYDSGSSNTDKMECMRIGYVYKVVAMPNSSGGTSYVYQKLQDKEGNTIKVGRISDNEGELRHVNSVKVLTTGQFYCMDDANSNLIALFDISDYHEGFRCATTPWIVSEVKGDGKTADVKKLFRFHTISDGTSSNSLIKISVTNIRPDDGLFDIQIRDFNDSDSAPVILESYRNLTMEEGNNNYIGLKIGTLDGEYEQMSKYVIAEIIQNDMTSTCVPAGFLGYPTRDYETLWTLTNLGIGEKLIAPTFTYNTVFDEDIKVKRQYFGLSDITGVDIDMLYYKGKNAYTEDYEYGYTDAFHLDSTMDPALGAYQAACTVDGQSGVTWTTVSSTFGTEYTHSPIIASEAAMEGCLYEDINTRKFTVYPYGGFDGWDIYRGARTTGDAFKANKYKGVISHGHGAVFSKLDNPEMVGLDSKAITSDYYAFLAGVKQFEIPEKYVINLLATPGVDYVNNTLLTDDIFDVVENKRGDAFYVPTTPDKPYGAGDGRDEMYTSAEASANLDDSNIDSYFAATYYPWVKYYDANNARYIYLPATKDVLRNMADVDNKSYPWMAPAGMERGNVNCVKMHFFARLEDEDNVYGNRINPLKTFSEDGVKVWGNKTMYTGDTPMNRINTVRCMLYMKKLIVKATNYLVFEPNDVTLKDQWEGVIKPVLAQIKKDRGITDYYVRTSQTPEQMDAHELSAKIGCKPCPTAEFFEISFDVTPQGVVWNN